MAKKKGKARLGTDPLEWVKDTRGEKASKPVSQQTSKKATFYFDPELIKKLKYLALETERDQSNLMNEALRDLLVKYDQ